LACKQRFSERRGTPLFQMRLSKLKIVEVLRLIAAGHPSHKIVSLSGVCRDSVLRIGRAAGDDVQKTLDILRMDLDRTEVRMDTLRCALHTTELQLPPESESKIRGVWKRLGEFLHHRLSRLCDLPLPELE